MKEKFIKTKGVKQEETTRNLEELKKGEASKLKNDKKIRNSISVKARIMIIIVALGLITIASGIYSVYNLNNVQKGSTKINEVGIRNMIDFDEIAGGTHRIQKLVYHIGNSKSDKEIKEYEEELASAYEDMMYYAEEALGNAEKDKKEIVNRMTENIKGLYENAQKSVNAVKSDNLDDFYSNIEANKEVSKKIEEDVYELIVANDDVIKEVLKNQLDMLKQSQMIALGLAVATLILIAFGILNIRSYIVIPLRNLETKLTEIISGVEAKKGDLSSRVNIKVNDEIGRVGININKFIETLEQIISKLIVNTQDMYNVIENVIGKIEKADTSVSDISALMEQLAASTQEVSATVESVSSETDEAHSEVVEMNNETINLLDYSKIMKSRAEEMKKAALETKEGTGSVVVEIVEKLDSAIENSKSIAQINNLTQDILAISEQTNLLSLNASIEAARAGEAGRGFAVVAGQIRELADSSKDAASNIQQLNSEIVGTVEQLIDNSKNMIKYINETILEDYDSFVDMGLKYDQDASHINEIMNDFNLKNQKLTSVMEMIAQKMAGISDTMEESSRGVMSAATNVTELVEGINDIHVNMDKNESIAKSLKKETDGFILK